MNPKLVIAVDAVRRGRSGPYVAAAVISVLPSPEPRFRYTDGRGAQREEFLLRTPARIGAKFVPVVAHCVRRATVAVIPYSLPLNITPKNADVARLITMYLAVRKAGDRLKYVHSDLLRNLRPEDLKLLVAGSQPLRSENLDGVQQATDPDRADWRVQAARFFATTAFQQPL